MTFIFPSFVSTSVYYVNLRYLVSAVPIILIFVAKGLNVFSDWLMEFSDLNKGIIKKTLKIPFLFQSFVIIGYLAFSLNPALRFALNLMPIYNIEFKETGLWMKENLPRNSIFIGRNAVNYYAGTFAFQPRERGTKDKLKTVEDLRDYKKEEDRPVFLFIEERYNKRYGALGYLIDEKRAPDFLKPAYINKQYRGAKAILYEVLDVE